MRLLTESTQSFQDPDAAPPREARPPAGLPTPEPLWPSAKGGLPALWGMVALPLFEPALLDPESPAVILGEPTGVFDDLWVRQHAAFSFRAQGAITAMSVEIWTPPEADPFVLAVRLENEPETILSAPAGHIAILQYPLYAAPFSEFTIELIAGAERQLHAPDQRRAAYKIRSLGFS